MSLMIDAIVRATDDGTIPAERSKVRDAIFDTSRPPQRARRIRINRNGDTTLRRYGVYTIVEGHLTFWESINA